MLRIVIVALGFIAVATGSAIVSAQAQRGTGAPWCLEFRGHAQRGQAAECSFYSLHQCRESATGNVGRCIRNPHYR